MLNFEEFARLVEFTFGFTTVMPKREQLQAVFAEMDRDGDGWVSAREWAQFVNRVFGGGDWKNSKDTRTITVQD